MKLQDKFIEKYGVDTLLHFGYGGWITALGLPFGFLCTFFMFLVTILLSVIKEKFLDDKFDRKDVIWSAGGAFVTVIFDAIIGCIQAVL